MITNRRLEATTMPEPERTRPRRPHDHLPQFAKSLLMIYHHPEVLTLGGWSRWAYWKLLERTGGFPRLIPFSKSMIAAERGCNVSKLIHSCGLYDLAPMRLLQSVLKPGDHMLDIGANIGSYSILAAECVGAEGRVLAMEPGPTAAARWRRNQQLNNLEMMSLVQAAAVAEPGMVCMTDDDGNAGNRIGVGSVEVEGRRVDRLLDSLKLTPRIIKIDVEGYEFGVLEGCGERLDADHISYIQFEANGLSETTATPLSDSLDLLKSRGFAIYELSEQLPLVMSPFHGKQPFSLTGNLFALSPRGVAELRELGVMILGN